MPIYEYKCQNGHVFDVIQKMSEDPLKTCVECGAPVKKLMHPVSISFKGSGFYSTDYSNGKKPEPVKNGASESKAGSDSDKKTDATSTEKAAKKD